MCRARRCRYRGVKTRADGDEKEKMKKLARWREQNELQVKIQRLTGNDQVSLNTSAGQM